MEKFRENNQVTISGEVASLFYYSHEAYGERFYTVDVSVERASGVCDVVPVTVSDRLINKDDDRIGEQVCVTGQYRSFNHHEGDKHRLVLSVFAKEIEFADELEENTKNNQIFLDGYVCKAPIYRKTPLGREIADLLIAVNRPYGKSDYIPCICWGRSAKYASTLATGSHIAVTGRIQSRSYNKRISDTEFEERTAYEVSLSMLEVVDDEE